MRYPRDYRTPGCSYAPSQENQSGARVRELVRGEDPSVRPGRAGRAGEGDRHRQVREAQGPPGSARAQGHASPAQVRTGEGEGLDRRRLRRAAAARSVALVYRRIRVRLLLDTNALVRWHLKKLRPAAVRTVERAELVVVSAISSWEIAIKGAVGKLDLKDRVDDIVARNRFLPLPVTDRKSTRLNSSH